MAEGDGAWVVLGRKIDRFQSPSGDPERPQGVPEAGRGVILSFVFVFFEKWSANFWLSPQMQPFQTNSWHDSRCRLPPLRPSAHPTWLQTKASNMLHLQGRTSTQQVQHGLAEEDDDIAAIHREYWRTLPRLSVPEMQFLWPEAHGVSSTQSGAEDESRARCLRLQGLQISELPWL